MVMSTFTSRIMPRAASSWSFASSSALRPTCAWSSVVTLACSIESDAIILFAEALYHVLNVSVVARIECRNLKLSLDRYITGHLLGTRRIVFTLSRLLTQCRRFTA
ncbi:hypothetical protein PLICRDRAFT_614660 [Plicaturopsis crispa FD-325 SS-3]|nr:hypothetical protein PLICRDRAFT_614660 [Plicaturopsis crispa FD-325 SS-3]